VVFWFKYCNEHLGSMKLRKLFDQFSESVRIFSTAYLFPYILNFPSFSFFTSVFLFFLKNPQDILYDACMFT
jgi:hypothetical protein